MSTPSTTTPYAETIRDDFPLQIEEISEKNIPLEKELPLTSDLESTAVSANAVAPVEEHQDFGPKQPLTTVRLVLVFLGIFVTLFLSALDQTIVTTTLPSIAAEFDNFSDISWVGTAYLITTTAVQPLYGITSGMFGRKRTMLFACIIFLIGSALCGAAQSLIMLIIARTVQGLGGSGIVALSMILVADIVPLRERGTYQGLVGLIYALAAVLGPLLGGVFADNVTWRWAFYINLPIGTLATALLMMFLHMNRRKNVPFLSNILSLDFTGIFLLVASIVMILLGLNWAADARYPWNSTTILCLLIVGVLVGILFVLNEWKHAKKPIIPLRLFKTLSLLFVYLNIFLQGFAFLGLMFFFPLYFQAVNEVSAIQFGIDLIPFVAMQAMVGFVTGILMSRWGTYKEFVVAGFGIGLVGSGLTTILNENTSKGVVVVVLLIQGVSHGLTIATLLLAIHAQLENKSDVAFGTSLWVFLRTFGGVFGIAVGSAFVQSSLSAAGASQYAQNIKAIAYLPEDVKGPVLRAFMEGLRKFFILLTAFSGVGFLSSLFIKKVTLGAKQKKQDGAGDGQTPEPILIAE
ncbi:hypothetical protein BGZ58_008526 [Dissophora ornata]|nr:hypothetical protein BGZ58_008526 [Dissophora ornata]